MKIYNYYLLIFLIILSTMDRFDNYYLSTNIMGITVRYSHIVSIFPALILIRCKKINQSFYFFIVSLIISGIYNNTTSSAISLVIAALISYYIFYLPALSFAKDYPDLGVRAILQSSRFLMLVGIVLQLSGYTERMAAFFYEPAYMSIFMAAYASLCFVEQKLVKPIDYIFLTIFLYSSKSAAFILVMFGIVFYLLFSKKRNFIKSLVIIYLMLLIYYLSIDRVNLNYKVVDAAISFEIKDLLEFSRQRTGERFDFMMISFSEVMKSPMFGIGPRAFQNMHNGIPPANIFLQIILEAGILGLIVCIFAIKNFFRGIGTLQRYKKFIACTSIALLTCLQIESTYMRAYLWVFFGIFNGIIINDAQIKEGIQNDGY